MFDVILEKLKQIISSRLIPVSIIFILLFGVLINRIFILQIVEGETHTEDISIKYLKTREIKSSRGNIYDRNGVLLAYNELTYAVVLEESPELTTNEDKNNMLYELIQILKKHKNVIENEFGISLDEDNNLYFNVEDKAQLRFKKNVYGLRSIDDLDKDQIEATAEEVFEYMRHGSSKYKTMFNISDEYSLEDTLDIMTLRYAIYTNYPKYNQIIISSGVNDETVAAIKENSANLPGVEIKEQTYRVYNDSVYFSHILGYTGLINAEELEKLQTDTDYNSSDVIGKTGIEKEFESYLAGTKGLENISVTSAGKYVETVERTDPTAGSDIYLTIDSNLQKSVYHIIERNLAGILLSKINNSMNAGTRGVSASDIRIPIYDVYFALINNNVIDIEAFEDNDATDLEKQVYQKFLTKQEDVMNDLKNLLALNNTKVNSGVSEEMEEYLTYIYSSILLKQKILLSSKIDNTDSNYIAYQNDEISLSQFLQHAIANNWIDLSKLNIGEQYYSTDEMYEKLLDFIYSSLLNDSTFNKKMYNYLVYSYKLSGTEICLLLFDQGVLKYNEEEKSSLKNGTTSAYTFITEKIRTLDITPAQLALDPSTASAVIVDSNTGDVIAMVSYPSYDNNMFANKIDSAYFNKLSNDLTRPLIHRAAKQRTAPGSTFKMITSTALLEEGVVGTSETIRDLLVFDRIDPAPKCWSTHSHGSVDVTTALEVSCNYFFYESAWRLGLDSNGNNKDQLGLDQLAKYASLYGLNEKAGIEVEEAEPIISNRDSIRSSIGQGDNEYTPLQISRYVTTVANGGNLYDLTILDKIVDKDNNILLENNAEFVTLTDIKASTWQLIQEGMYKVANGARSSSSKMFKDFPITVAGKTGTAQVGVNKPNHALFVSYAPYIDPEISVTVVIPNGHGSGTAVELTRDIYSYYFDLEDSEQLVNGPADLPISDTRGFAD